MGNAKIHRTSKKTYARLGIIIFVVLLLGWLYYQSQRPNYRDLEKAYSQLQIPADWQQIGQSDNKGTWGLFCWQIGGSECPHILKNFVRDSGAADGIKSTLSDIESNLISSGYHIDPNSYNKCTQQNIEQGNYSCSVAAAKNKERVYFALVSDGPQGKTGNYAIISVSPVSD